MARRTYVVELDTETQHAQKNLLGLLGKDQLEPYVGMRLKYNPNLKFLFYEVEVIDEIIIDEKLRISPDYRVPEKSSFV